MGSTLVMSKSGKVMTIPRDGEPIPREGERCTFDGDMYRVISVDHEYTHSGRWRDTTVLVEFVADVSTP